MGKQRRFVIFAEGEGFTVRGVAALKRHVDDLLVDSAYPVDEVVVYEGAIGDNTLSLIDMKEV